MAIPPPPAVARTRAPAPGKPVEQLQQERRREQSAEAVLPEASCPASADGRKGEWCREQCRNDEREAKRQDGERSTGQAVSDQEVGFSAHQIEDRLRDGESPEREDVSD